MKLGLIISNDWELYGDGSGDYFEIQHQPLRDLLDVAESHGVKITVLADICQQWAHKKIRNQYPWAGEIADAWESMLIEVIRRGCDVQLHLHPQWLAAEYENNRWHLDMDHWAISSLRSDVMEKILADGKNYLEKLFKPIAPEYKCIAFRAGAYCIEPSENVIRNLLKVGILCDTSVTKGLKQKDNYDFSDAFSNHMPWFADSTAIKYRSSNNSGLLEIPIHSFIGLDSYLLNRLTRNRFFNLFHFGILRNKQDMDWQLEREEYIQKKYTSRNRYGSTKSMEMKPNLSYLLSKIASTRVVQLDYDKLSPHQFVGCLSHVFKRMRSLKGRDIILPIMSSGHTKNMHNVDNIRKILDLIDRKLKGRIDYWTLTKANEYCRERFIRYSDGAFF